MRTKEPKTIHSTGWFGIPGGNGRGSTKVHCVDDQSKPVCGARLSPKQRFQFCSAGVYISIVECDKCKAIARKEFERDVASKLPKYKGLPP